MKTYTVRKTIVETREIEVEVKSKSMSESDFAEYIVGTKRDVGKLVRYEVSDVVATIKS